MSAAPPFGVDHIRPHCHNILIPPDITPDDLLWGFRLCHVDMTSRNGYRWPFPGNWAVADPRGRTFTRGAHGCPTFDGDGICVAHTLRGATSGEATVNGVGLLVAYLPADVLAEEPDKLRAQRVWVADTFRPLAAITSAASVGANLRGANLEGAYLRGAMYSQGTLFPVGFDVAASGAVKW